MADTTAGWLLYFTPARVTARPARCRSVVAVNNLQTRTATSVKIIADLFSDASRVGLHELRVDAACTCGCSEPLFR